MSHGQRLGNSDCRKRSRWVCNRDPRTDAAARLAPLLPVVWSVLQAACDGRISPEVLLDGTPTGILDRCTALDDAGDRRGPTLGRLPEGNSHQRARCLSAIPIVRDLWWQERRMLASSLSLHADSERLRISMKMTADQSGPL